MKKKYSMILLGLIVAVASALSLFFPEYETNVAQLRQPEAKACVYFLDVGQGDAALIRSANNKTILIDSGTNESESKYLAYLRNLEVEKIDVLIASHPHSDHIGAFDEVIRRYDVDEIYMTKESVISPSFDDFTDAMREKGLKAKEAKKGVEFSIDGISFRFLHPQETLTADTNANSAVVLCDVYGKKFLFTGDRENLTTKEIYGQLEKIDVLKVGHHGSAKSVQAKAMRILDPAYAVFCAGLDNDYGHPTRAALEGIQETDAVIYRTDQDGTIAFSIMQDGSMVVHTAKQGGLQ